MSSYILNSSILIVGKKKKQHKNKKNNSDLISVSGLTICNTFANSSVLIGQAGFFSVAEDVEDISFSST